MCIWCCFTWNFGARIKVCMGGILEQEPKCAWVGVVTAKRSRASALVHVHSQLYKALYLLHNLWT